MTNMEKAIELLKNEDFAKKVAACGDQNAALELFKNNGAAITSTELENIGKYLQAAKDSDGEIPDELAEKVAGGIDLANVLTTIGGIIASLGPMIQQIINLFNPQATPTDGGAPQTQAGGDSSSQGEQKQEQAQA